MSAGHVIAIQGAREVEVWTPARLLERRAIVQQVIEEVMTEGVHYGKIAGTRELSLLKEGAELLLSTFNIAVEPTVTDLCTQTEVRFQVECRGIHMGTQTYMGSGIGVCSSNEEKYRWRAARSKKEYEAAEPAHRRIKYGTDFEVAQVRQSPWDVFQTIMSMAKKRGMVDLAKTVLAASECLKKARLRSGSATKTGGAAPTPQGKPAADPAAAWAAQQDRAPGRVATPAGAAAANQPPPTIDAATGRELLDLIDRAGVPENAFYARFELGSIGELEQERLDAARAWIQANSA